MPVLPSRRALARATAQGWTRTPWVGWDVDSCRPGQRCLQELGPLL
jgi:hypothetical protein